MRRGSVALGIVVLGLLMILAACGGNKATATPGSGGAVANGLATTVTGTVNAGGTAGTGLATTIVSTVASTGSTSITGTGAAGSASAGGPFSANGALTVDVTEKDFAIAMDKMTIPSGAVTFNIKNAGPSRHNLGIVKGGGASQAQGITGSAIKESETIDAGKTTTLTLNLVPGTYAVVSTVPGDVQRGMITTLTVT